jgi:hypothetical protein
MPCEIIGPFTENDPYTNPMTKGDVWTNFKKHYSFEARKHLLDNPGYGIDAKDLKTLVAQDRLRLKWFVGRIGKEVSVNGEKWHIFDPYSAYLCYVIEWQIKNKKLWNI